MEVNYIINCFFLIMVQLLYEGGIFFLEIICCVVNFVFVLIVVLFNSIVIFVVWKILFFYILSNVFIFCLVGLDFVIGFVVQFLFVVYKIVELSDDVKIVCDGRFIYWIVGFVCVGVLVMIIVMIVVDKMLVLQLYF